MKMTTEVTTTGGGAAAMSLKQVTDRVNLVHQVLEKVMIGPSKANPNGVHYGTVPGCGKKKVLFKPGADLLAMTFRLVPKFDVIRKDLDGGHREYDVTCSMYGPGGELLGQGVGSCSTMEKKYRYRGGEGDDTGNPVPPAFWDLKRAGKLDEAKQLIGGKGFSAKKTDEGEWHIFETTGEREENQDIADVYNTVLKMAKKRAQIDATLTVTGAADMFTQDLIDEEDPGSGKAQHPDRPPIAPTTARESAAPAGNAPADPPADTLEVSGLVEKINPKNGKKPAQVFVGGKPYASYHDGVITVAAKAFNDKAEVTIQYHVGPYGNDIEALELK
jgi:hypothetical protein